MITKSKFEQDLLDRKSAIEDLSGLISSTAEPLTLAINAAWGAGKTIFVKELWKPYLKEKHGIESFYFSAWENDFSKEPLISILGEFNTYAKAQGIESKFKKSKEFAGKILKLAITRAVEKAIGVDIAPLIEEYSSTKEHIEAFKKEIALALQAIYPKGNSKPFVIFADELDRCRPLYAIEFLERIKHLFNIEKLIFVLSIDKKQLAESIKSQYGNIDTDSYLRRFIDIEYQLPQGTLENFCKVKVEEFNLKETLQNKKINPDEPIEWLLLINARIFGASLRTLEQILLRLSIIYKTIPSRLFPAHFRPIVFLAFIKSYNSNLYNQFIKGEEKERIRHLVNQHKNSNENNEVNRYIRYLNVIIDATRLNTEEIDNLVKTLPKNERGELDWPQSLLKDNLNPPFYTYRINDLIDTAIKKIEFTDKFVLEDS